MNYVGSDYDAFFLLTSSEYYYQSVMLSFELDSTDVTPTQGAVAFTNTLYGSIWNFWPFKAAETSTSSYIAAQVPDNLILVGTFKGKGSVFRGTTTDSV